MSGAFVNATVGGTLVVAGTTTLSGALTSSSSINSQEIITTKMTTTGNVSCSALNVVGNVFCGYLESATDVSASSLFITTNSVVKQNSEIYGDMSLHGDLQMDASKQIFFKNSLVDYIKYDSAISGVAISSSTAGRIGTDAKTDLISYNTSTINLNGNLVINKNTQFTTNLPSTLIVPTAYFELTNKQYVDTQTGFLSGNVALLQTKTINQTYNGVSTNFSGITSHTGPIGLNDNPIYLRTGTDVNHSLQYDATTDGPALKGITGGKLGTVPKTDVLTWNTSGVSVNGNTSLVGNVNLLGTGVMAINDKPLYFRTQGDINNSIQYNSTANGPFVKGASGGYLGTPSKGDILTWNTTGGAVHSVNVNGNTNCVGNVLLLGTNTVMSLGDRPLYLRYGDDSSHSLQYNATSDGPALKGTSGGKIGTTTKTDILTWNTTAGIHSVGVNGNLNITGAINELNSGSSSTFYRKTGCGTNETYNFQPSHGIYTVFYNINHDRYTTASYYVYVLNNVNGGSVVVPIFEGFSMSASINTITNVFTINSPFSNGILLINKIMSFS